MCLIFPAAGGEREFPLRVRYSVPRQFGSGGKVFQYMAYVSRISGQAGQSRNLPVARDLSLGNLVDDLPDLLFVAEW